VGGKGRAIIPQVIDSLFVELGLDPSKFTQGQKAAIAAFKKTQDEALRVGKNIEDSGKKAAEFFTGIKTAALGLFTVLVGTDMAHFARETTATVAATGRLARNIQANTKDLAAFANVVERNGGNAEEAASSMANLTQTVERFRIFGQASQEFQIAMGTIGATADMTALQDYMKFADWASAHRDDPAFVNLIGKQLGLDQGSINAALQGSAKLNEQLRQSRQFAPSREDAEKLQNLQASWTLLDNAVSAVGRDLLIDVEPVFDGIAKASGQWIANNRQLADTLGSILTIMVGLISLKPAAWLLKLLGLSAVTPVAALAAGAAGTGYALTKINESLAPQGVYMDLDGNLYPLDAGTNQPAKPIAPPSLSDKFKHWLAPSWYPATKSVATKYTSGAPSTLLDRVRMLERSGDSAVSPKGAIGRYQITPATALRYGFDPARLTDPGYNEMVARAVLSDLSTRYHGNEADILAAYNAGPARADQWIAGTRGLPAETLNYLRRDRDLLARGATGSAAGSNVTTDVTINGGVNINTKATDADGIARDAAGALRERVGRSMSLATQANAGLTQ
jgi:hypothetical protein